VSGGGRRNVFAQPFGQIDDFAGRRIVTAPFSDTCDPLIKSPEAWPELLGALQSHGLPVNIRCLSEQRVSETDEIEVVKRARWHRLSTLLSTEDLWQRVSPEARRAIRRSKTAGMEIRSLDGSLDLAAFHQLHVALRKRKYRLLAQPLTFFEALERRFREAEGWYPLGAYLGSQLIAATIYLKWGDTLYYKFNASSAEALRARPNNRLVWEGILLAKALDCRYLDLGPSDDHQQGLIRFKKNLGAEESELQFLRWNPPNWSDDSNRRRVLTEITQNMTEPSVSDSVTAEAGAAFYRFFAG